MEKKEIRINGGYAILNKVKRSPKSPDYTGKININGQNFYISIWKKDDEILTYSVKSVEQENEIQTAINKPTNINQNTPKKQNEYEDIDALDRLFKDFDESEGK